MKTMKMIGLGVLAAALLFCPAFLSADKAKDAIDSVKKQTEELKKSREALKAKSAKTTTARLTIIGNIVGAGSDKITVDANSQMTDIYMDSETKVNNGKEKVSEVCTKVLNVTNKRKLSATIVYDTSKGYKVAKTIDAPEINNDGPPPPSAGTDPGHCVCK